MEVVVIAYGMHLPVDCALFSESIENKVIGDRKVKSNIKLDMFHGSVVLTVCNAIFVAAVVVLNK